MWKMDLCGFWSKFRVQTSFLFLCQENPIFELCTQKSEGMYDEQWPKYKETSIFHKFTSYHILAMKSSPCPVLILNLVLNNNVTSISHIHSSQQSSGPQAMIYLSFGHQEM